MATIDAATAAARRRTWRKPKPLQSDVVPLMGSELPIVELDIETMEVAKPLPIIDRRDVFPDGT